MQITINKSDYSGVGKITWTYDVYIDRDSVAAKLIKYVECTKKCDKKTGKAILEPDRTWDITGAIPESGIFIPFSQIVLPAASNIEKEIKKKISLSVKMFLYPDQGSYTAGETVESFKKRIAELEEANGFLNLNAVLGSV